MVRFLTSMYFIEKNLRSLSHLDEEHGPELPPDLRLAQRAMARQVGPFGGDDGVRDPHHHHADQEAEEARGGQQEEGCAAEKS